jgi:hypothetical protein
VNDIEHVEYPRIESDDKVVEVSEGGDAACWAHLVCPECGEMHESSVHAT